jgi:hypothetical protein
MSRLVKTTSFVSIFRHIPSWSVFAVPDKSVYVKHIEARVGGATYELPVKIETHLGAKIGDEYHLTLGCVVKSLYRNEGAFGTHRVILFSLPYESCGLSCKMLFTMSNGHRVFHNYSVIATKNNVRLLASLQQVSLDGYKKLGQSLNEYRESPMLLEKVKDIETKNSLVDSYLETIKKLTQ